MPISPDAPALPTVYWCAYAHLDTVRGRRAQLWSIAPHPAGAVDWLRASVLAVLPGLDAEAARTAGVWLTEPQGAATAFRALQDGRSHELVLANATRSTGRRSWVAQPLPLHPVITAPREGRMNSAHTPDRSGRHEGAQSLIAGVAAADALWQVPAMQVVGASEAKVRAIRQVDRRNTDMLKAVVADHGWPGPRLFGARGSHAALWIALSSDHDPAFQRELLQHLANAVRSGDATRMQWAYLYDRCCVHAGSPQLYGTQHTFAEGELQLYPVDVPEQLDARRASVGLPPYSPAEPADEPPDQVSLTVLHAAPGSHPPETDHRRHTETEMANKPADAEEAGKLLDAALRSAGLQLPGLGTSPVKVHGQRGGSALVTLGQVSAVVAEELAALIRKGASA